MNRFGLSLIGVLALSFPVSAGDEAPPGIDRVVVEPAPDGSAVSIRARIRDEGGIGSAWVQVVDPEGAPLVRLEMRPAGGDTFEASVPGARASRGRVHYYVGAVDAAGNGPTLYGSPARPYRVVLDHEAATAPASGRLRLVLVLGILGAAAAALLRIRRNASPSSGPAVRPKPTLEQTFRALEEDIFWIQLLRPLVKMPEREARRAITAMAGRPHAHPHAGRRTFAEATLRDRLEWARRTDPVDLQKRWRRAIKARHRVHGGA